MTIRNDYTFIPHPGNGNYEPLGWWKRRGGQPLAWQTGMKEITKRSGTVDSARLPEKRSRDPHCTCLETLQDMVASGVLVVRFYPSCLNGCLEL
ncbi:hypothetical protein T265_11959 [Opisthorchis viverrini]|uniref:Uncharacterized protein n=1 Tax=Opisthorchis viverrini TaxID=6198 RepID=A0A074Z139_OPIVI|nr:hypothetical protein T265_11959 [Opisthorchis viverrini]KER19177.1 hypothetical protein T265_11959 [Opisthorchis viverrini]